LWPKKRRYGARRERRWRFDRVIIRPRVLFSSGTDHLTEFAAEGRYVIGMRDGEIGRGLVITSLADLP